MPAFGPKQHRQPGIIVAPELREGPSGQRMNVGRHNNAKISLLNGLVWTRQGRRENRILILCCPGCLAYRFLPLETNLIAVGQSQGREVLLFVVRNQLALYYEIKLNNFKT